MKELTYGKLIFYMVTIVCLIGTIIFVYNNHSFYERTIAKVTGTDLVDTEEHNDQYDNEDKIYTQKISAVVKNGDAEGKEIELYNQYSLSGAYDHQFREGSEVFVAQGKDDRWEVKDVKRDKYMVIIAWIFILTLLLIGRKQGLFASLSLAINILILSYALDIYVNTGVNLLWICAIIVVLFTVISLLFVNGFNEKTYAAIIATLLGTFLALGITFLAIWLTGEEGLRYEEMQFLTRPYHLVFLAGLFIGSLGAVMDVAISISAGLFELYESNKDISVKALKESGMDIGKDIMGTMTNILFFAYVSGSIPILILYFKNLSPLGFTLSINLSLEFARALSGGIGIVLTIPIGLYTTIFFIKRKRAKS